MSAILKCCCFVALIVIGFLIKKYAALAPKLLKLVTALVMWVLMPCSVIYGYSDFQVDASVIPIALLALAANGILACVGGRLGKTAEERAEGIILFTGYNTGCFALPFAQTFFGSAGVIATCVFDAVNVLFCCGGSYALACSLGKKGQKNDILSFLKTLLSSHIFLIYLLMLTLNLAGLRLPQPLVSFTGFLSPATGYMAMLMIGLGFDKNLGLASLKTVLRPVGARLTVSLLLAAVLLLVPWFAAEGKAVALVNLFAPFTILAPIYIRKYGLPTERASLAISASSLISVFFLSVISLGWQALALV